MTDFFYILFHAQKIESFIALSLISSSLILETIIYLKRRFLNHKNIFMSHKIYLYQRLYKRCSSNLGVSLIYILSTTLLSLTFKFLGINSLLIHY